MKLQLFISITRKYFLSSILQSWIENIVIWDLHWRINVLHNFVLIFRNFIGYLSVPIFNKLNLYILLSIRTHRQVQIFTNRKTLKKIYSKRRSLLGHKYVLVLLIINCLNLFVWLNLLTRTLLIKLLKCFHPQNLLWESNDNLARTNWI